MVIKSFEEEESSLYICIKDLVIKQSNVKLRNSPK